MKISPALVSLALVAVTPTGATSQERHAMDPGVYEIWQRIQESQISDNGNWVTFTVSPMLGDGVLHVKSVNSDTEHLIPRGASARFSENSRFVAFLVKPQDSIVRRARIDDVDDDEMPKDSLGILDLRDGTVQLVPNVKSFKMPEEGSGWIAYLLHPGQASPAADSADAPEGPGETEAAAGEERKKKEEGTTLVLRNLESGAESSFELIESYAFSEDGRRLAFAISSKHGDADGVFIVTDGSEPVSVLEGAGHYKSLGFSKDGSQLAFVSNRSEWADEDRPAYELYHWTDGDAEAVSLAAEGTDGVPDGWWVSENGTLSFSDSGERLFFFTSPRPLPEFHDSTPEWERINVDIWHWQDPLLQPQQLVELNNERTRSYRAVVHLDDGRVVQLADTLLRRVTIGQHGDAATGIANTNRPYRQEISWDSPRYNDVYLVDVETGERRRVVERLQGSASLSPGGSYVSWWDGRERAWFAMPAEGGVATNLTGSMSVAFHNELHDAPSIPPPYGVAGWTEGDERFLAYDSYDIWAIDPTGQNIPRTITEGWGRENEIRFRYVRLDPEQIAIDSGDQLLLSAFNLTTKAAGFYRDRVNGNGRPSELTMEDRRFGRPVRAEDEDVLLFTRESFREFPDLWTSDERLRGMRRQSDANPQASDYLWGTVELVHWRATDGRPHDGLLFKPENFDSTVQYPMMVYFYEKNSNNLHQHRAPFAHRSVINATYYTSRGYVVFIPDIHYRDGYPGESAMNSVMSGTLNIIERGFVDPERVGVQGHSWGGYQIAYMVTRTNLFAAAEAGAPVANMTSAYGGIRWDTGLSRMFQYERTQSRLGGTLWDMRPRYIENSPIFWADRIETPLLMMHNDHDGHVPWYQGIEMFVALRRLGKPAWLVNYNGQRHWPTTEWKRRDWQLRMQGFFDHYLMGAPAPRWLENGIPAVNKGRDLGF